MVDDALRRRVNDTASGSDTASPAPFCSTLCPILLYGTKLPTMYR